MHFSIRFIIIAAIAFAAVGFASAGLKLKIEDPQWVVSVIVSFSLLVAYITRPVEP